MARRPHGQRIIPSPCKYVRVGEQARGSRSYPSRYLHATTTPGHVGRRGRKAERLFRAGASSGVSITLAIEQGRRISLEESTLNMFADARKWNGGRPRPEE